MAKIICPNTSPCTTTTSGATVQTIYVYDAAGDLAAEYSPTAPVVVIPNGAVRTGRVRIMQKDALNRYLVELEFTDLTFGNLHGRFMGDLQRLDAAAGVQIVRSDKLSTYEQVTLIGDQSIGTMQIETREMMTPPQLPGVATFFVLENRVQLAAGIWMVWRTGS